MAKKAKKLPKTIAGIRLSKPVRKAGGRLVEAASSPRGREVIAAGLAMAAAAAAARTASAHDPNAGTDADSNGAANGAASSPSAVDALGSVAASFIAGLSGRRV